MNYIQHNKELDGALYKPEEPVIFIKADSALLKGGKPFFLPDWSERVDYEAELVVRINRLGKGIPREFAHRYYDTVTVGIDFTARDLQQKARSKGLPWTVCKGFDGSAVIGEWTQPPLPSSPEGEGIDPIRFRLDVNGQTVQQGNSSDMLYSVDELVSYLSRYFTLRMGDLIFTGTPAGVGPVHIGDHLEGYLEDRKVLDFRCK